MLAEAGAPDLSVISEHAEGAGLVSAQAMVVSLTEAGGVTRRELGPYLESAHVDGDTATVRDCYRADLVEHDATNDEQVADRGGARFQATATLERHDPGWVITESAEGDVCAPSEIAAEVRDRYRAFWDAGGHSSPTMMRRYRHAVDEIEHGAATAMDAALRSRTPSEAPSTDADDEPPKVEIRQLR